MTLSYIDALLRDARLVAEYSAAIGGRQDTELVTAIDAVERLPANQRTLAAPQVVALSQVYAKAREGVPFKEFYALRNGWCIFPSFWRRAWTVVMVLAAIAFMICTLHLTRIYNRGVDISATLTVLEESEAEIRYGELERRLMDAQDELGEAAAVAEQSVATEKPAQVDKALDGTKQGARLGRDVEQFFLAREASHRMLNELVNLDQRITTVNRLAGEFQHQSRYPIAGQQSLENSALSLWDKIRSLVSFTECPFGFKKVPTGCAYEGAGAASAGSAPALAFDPRLARMRETFCGKVELLEDYAQGRLTKADLKTKDKFLSDLAHSIDESLGVDTAEAIVRSCILGLNFYSGAFPDIEALNMQIKDALNLYSLIILPSLFGALGAIVYFLRAFLNPKEPNEGWSRTLYHVALGALAGMIMAWLGMGLLGSDDAFKSIGLGLFAFAFVLGFSIDIFFDMLENLVKSARRAVGQIGSANPDGTTPGTAGGTPIAGSPPAAPAVAASPVAGTPAAGPAPAIAVGPAAPATGP